ncbi:MAG: hypothetical protein KJO07_07745 [Deltaproteobacteria bacterium]|nr:hypothetical protein [Deltaproteobacteria bacterium]
MRLAAAILVVSAGCGRLSYDQLAAESTDSGVDVDASAACTVQLGAGREHFCLLTPSDGAVRCWGDNQFGQLGIGNMDDQPSPVTVPLDGPAVDVNGGRYETCAALDSGLAYCWGEGSSGQLGDGLGATSPSPVLVDTLTDIPDIAVGAIHACARQSSGQVYCWGNNGLGRLGLGTSGGTELSPVPVPALTDARELAMSGGSTTCTIRSDDSLWCWGNNAQGSVGDGTLSPPLQPVPATRSRRSPMPLACSEQGSVTFKA